MGDACGKLAGRESQPDAHMSGAAPQMAQPVRPAAAAPHPQEHAAHAGHHGRKEPQAAPAAESGAKNPQRHLKKGGLKRGTSVIDIPAEAGAPALKAMCFVPEEFDAATTPFLFVLHGFARDSAQDYFDDLLHSGEPQRLGVACFVPVLSEEAFPKRNGYNFGNVFAKDPLHAQNAGKEDKPDHVGAPAAPAMLPKMRPIAEWAFHNVERVFDTAVQMSDSQQTQYYMVGHSAGAQFVHRHMLFLSAHAAAGQGSHPRCAHAVCCNAGWWTMPTLGESAYQFPFGIGGVSLPLLQGGKKGRDAQGGVDPEVAKAYVSTPLTVLNGECDTDPNKPCAKIWCKDPGAAVQGPHRLGRGESFLKAGEATAAALGVQCAWRRQTVPGVGHEGSKMTAHAVRLLFDPSCHGKVDTHFKPKAGKSLF